MARGGRNKLEMWNTELILNSFQHVLSQVTIVRRTLFDKLAGRLLAFEELYWFKGLDVESMVYLNCQLAAMIKIRSFRLLCCTDL